MSHLDSVGLRMFDMMYVEKIRYNRDTIRTRQKLKFIGRQALGVGGGWVVIIQSSMVRLDLLHFLWKKDLALSFPRTRPLVLAVITISFSSTDHELKNGSFFKVVDWQQTTKENRGWNQKVQFVRKKKNNKSELKLNISRAYGTPLNLGKLSLGKSRTGP